jgi:plastocyanin
MKKVALILAASILFAGACSKAKSPGASNTSPSAMTTSPSAASAPCSPNGTALKVSASNTTFDTNCLAAPAGQAFTIAFDNKDSMVHNVQILKGSQSVFDGDLVTGPKTQAYNVPALAAGTYEFHCKVHPAQMKGVFVVQ